MLRGSLKSANRVLTSAKKIDKRRNDPLDFLLCNRLESQNITVCTRYVKVEDTYARRSDSKPVDDMHFCTFMK